MEALVVITGLIFFLIFLAGCMGLLCGSGRYKFITTGTRNFLEKYARVLSWLANCKVGDNLEMNGYTLPYTLNLDGFEIFIMKCSLIVVASFPFMILAGIIALVSVSGWMFILFIIGVIGIIIFFKTVPKIMVKYLNKAGALLEKVKEEK